MNSSPTPTSIVAAGCHSASPESPVVAGVLGRGTDSAASAVSHLAPGHDNATRHAELAALAAALDCPKSSLVALRQVHGTAFHRVGPGPELNAKPDVNRSVSQNGDWACGTGDALFTDAPGTVLVIRTADCLPVFFDLAIEPADGPASRMVGLIHAGWRGLAAGIVRSTLSAALSEFCEAHAAKSTAAGSPASIISARVWCGPAISGPRYEVSGDVAAHFQMKQPGRASDKFLVDLTANAEMEISSVLGAMAGPAVTIERRPAPQGFAACTWDANDRFYSHRRGDVGRNLNYIYLKSEE